MSATIDVIVDAPEIAVIDVVMDPPTVVAVDVLAPPPSIAVIEVADFGPVPIGYSQLPGELRQLPIAFPFSGRPAAGSQVNVPMGFRLTVPDGLAGTVSFAMSPPDAPAVFEVNRITEAGAIPLGTVTVMPGSHANCILAGPGGLIEAGEVLQFIAPEQDVLLSDVGITVLCNRM